MSLYFSQPYDEDIQKYYEYSLNNESPQDINCRLYGRFNHRVSELKIFEIFEEFEKKLEQFEGERKSQIEYEKQYDELCFEYNKIIRDSREIWDFNYVLIKNLDFEYYKLCEKTGKKGFTNINKDILDNMINSFKKFDKDLIIIKNKINDLINLIF